MKIKKGDHLVFTYINDPKIHIIKLCLSRKNNIAAGCDEITTRVILTHPNFKKYAWVGRICLYRIDQYSNALEYNSNVWNVKIIRG